MLSWRSPPRCRKHKLQIFVLSYILHCHADTPHLLLPISPCPHSSQVSLAGNFVDI